MDNKEYDNLSGQLDYYYSIRNTLLTFSFTTVLAALGVALSSDSEELSVYIYLLPFCLLIPFTARIVYYRIVHARITSFLMVYAPEKMQFSLRGKNVPENQTKYFNVIAVLVNFETTILSIACALIFVFKYLDTYTLNEISSYLIFAIPIVLVLIVFSISLYGFKYSKHQKRYFKLWEQTLYEFSDKPNANKKTEDS